MKIFINYRRDISKGTAGRLFDVLAPAFGRANVFMDVDSNPVGVNFVAHLDAKVAECDVFLALVESNWLSVSDRSGQRKLDNPGDFVRIEIEGALKRAKPIPVIPVLVDDARMPSAEELPESLRDLVHRHAVSVHHAQFATDAERLIRKIRAIKQTRRMRYSVYLIWAALIIAIVGTVVAMRSSYQATTRQEVEAANQEAATRQMAAKQEAAKQEAAKQEEAGKQEKAAKQETAKQEAAKQEAAKQEAAKQEAAKQEAEAAKQEAAKQEAAKQEAAKQEAAKQEAAKQEAAKQEAAKQEAAKQEAAKQEAAKQEAAKQEVSADPTLQTTQSAGFDGQWESETTWADCRLGGQTVVLHIVNGAVSVDGRRPRNLSGSVNTQGKIKFRYDIRDETGTEWTNFFEGSISGNRGAGRAWSRYCSGTFAMKRK
jgi:chemotaxis protein histidine kinase CheA